MATTTSAGQTFPFGRLPPELKVMVIGFTDLRDENPIKIIKKRGEFRDVFKREGRTPPSEPLSIAVLKVSRLFNAEGSKVLYGKNHFVFGCATACHRWFAEIGDNAIEVRSVTLPTLGRSVQHCSIGSGLLATIKSNKLASIEVPFVAKQRSSPVLAAQCVRIGYRLLQKRARSDFQAALTLFRPSRSSILAHYESRFEVDSNGYSARQTMLLHYGKNSWHLADDDTFVAVWMDLFEFELLNLRAAGVW